MVVVRLCGGGASGSGVRVAGDWACGLRGSDSPYGGSRNAAPVTGAASRDGGASCRRGVAFECGGCARGWSIVFNIYLCGTFLSVWVLIRPPVREDPQNPSSLTAHVGGEVAPRVGRRGSCAMCEPFYYMRVGLAFTFIYVSRHFYCFICVSRALRIAKCE